MEIKYYQLEYDDIEQISRLENRFFSSPWSEASIGHYAEAGNTIFIVARSDEPYITKAGSGTQCQDREELAASDSGNSQVDVDVNNFPRRVAGYAAVLCAADEGNLVSIGVDDDYREMGIATELLDIIYGMAQERGVASINLEVRESNVPAISLYEKEGFEAVGRRKNFYRDPAEDALLYIKKL